MGIAALILSIVTIIFSFVPFLNIIAIFTGTLSFVLAIISLIRLQNSRKKGWGKSLAAIILCTISMWIIIFSFSYSIVLLDRYNENFEDYDKYTYNTHKYTNNYDKYNKYNNYNNYNNYNFNKRKYNNQIEKMLDLDDMYNVFN